MERCRLGQLRLQKIQFDQLKKEKKKSQKHETDFCEGVTRHNYPIQHWDLNITGNKKN